MGEGWGRRGRGLGALLAAAFFACASYPSMRIHTEQNPRADVALYQTYGWTAPATPPPTRYRDDFAEPLSDPPPPPGAEAWSAERTDQQIRTLADAELNRLGYQRSARPQILLSWHVSTQRRHTQDTWGDFARYRAEGGTKDAGDAWIDGYEEGSLVIEARDSRNRALLWYGTATAVVNPELRDQRVPEAVTQIFARWPPRAGY